MNHKLYIILLIFTIISSACQKTLASAHELLLAEAHKPSGLKKGFFNESKKPQKITPTNLDYSPSKSIKQYDNTEPENDSVWTNPQYQDFDFINATVYAYIKKYSRDDFIFDKTISFANNQGGKFLRLHYLIENDIQFKWITQTSHSNHYPHIFYILLVLGDKLIKNSLTVRMNKDSVTKVILGNEHCGVINYSPQLTINIIPQILKFSYYSVQDHNLNNRYIIYNNQKCKSFTWNIETYSVGSNAFEPLDSYNFAVKNSLDYCPVIQNRFILQKDRGLLKPIGQHVITLGEVFADDLQISIYSEDPYTNLPYTVQICKDECIDSLSPDKKLLVDIMGGLDLLKNNGILLSLVKQHNVDQPLKLLPIQARALLTLAYDIQESVLNGSESHNLKDIVDIALNVMVDDELQDESKSIEFTSPLLTDEQIAQWPEVKEQIDQQIKHIDSLTSLHKKQKKLQKRKIAKTAIVNARKQLELEDQSKKKERSREKIALKIRNDILEEIKRNKNFSRQELQELLGSMTEGFEKLGLKRLSAKAEGSHAAVKLKNVDTGETATLSLARRAQKTGYQAGTVRTILVDNFNKLCRAALGKSLN